MEMDDTRGAKRRGLDLDRASAWRADRLAPERGARAGALLPRREHPIYARLAGATTGGRCAAAVEMPIARSAPASSSFFMAYLPAECLKRTTIETTVRASQFMSAGRSNAKASTGINPARRLTGSVNREQRAAIKRCPSIAEVAMVREGPAEPQRKKRAEARSFCAGAGSASCLRWD